MTLPVSFLLQETSAVRIYVRTFSLSLTLPRSIILHTTVRTSSHTNGKHKNHDRALPPEPYTYFFFLRKKVTTFPFPPPFLSPEKSCVTFRTFPLFFLFSPPFQGPSPFWIRNLINYPVRDGIKKWGKLKISLFLRPDSSRPPPPPPLSPLIFFTVKVPPN